MRRLVSTLSVIVAMMAWAATAASGDGGPSPGVDQAGEGVVYRGLRYVAIPMWSRTLIEAIRIDGGLVRTSRVLQGRYGIPFVTNTGVTGGVSHDGSMLVLGDASCCGLRAVSSLLVLRARNLRTYRHIVLRGDFAFDALSPNGDMLYLIQHTSARDFTRYRVRAYDVLATRLLPGAIVDRREPNEVMRGYPAARTTTADGAWVYTLYAGGRKPFVHALDTVHGKALCLEFPWRGPQDPLWQMSFGLASDGRTLLLRGGGKSLEVRRPG